MESVCGQRVRTGSGVALRGCVRLMMVVGLEEVLETWLKAKVKVRGPQKGQIGAREKTFRENRQKIGKLDHEE